MKRTSLYMIIIMIHSGVGVLAMTALDFNKEIEMVAQDQYKEHLITLNQVHATEAAVEFENRFRSPKPTRALTFFPIKIRPKPFMKPKTKVANQTPPPPPSPQPTVDIVQLYRQQTL